MKRILLFVPDGTGVRNYLYSNVFKSDRFSITLLHDFDGSTLDDIHLELPLSGSERIGPYREGILERFLRETIHRCRLSYNSRKQQNPTIMKFWRSRTSGFATRMFYLLVVLTSNLIRSYRSILFTERIYVRTVKGSKYYSTILGQIREIDPEVVFCTHQRAIKAPVVMMAAKELGIQTVSVIYSWDNLPKARLPFRADRFLLWSDVMRAQMETFYPEINPDQLIVTGSPQFEFYADNRYRIDRDAFFSRFGLDPDRKIICFSGDDVRTSPYDPLYLRDLAEQIKAHGLDRQYQIAFRRCPVDLSDRYDQVLKEHSDLIVAIPPLWSTNDREWSAVYPKIEDVALLVSLAHHADLVVNVGSTMAFDFGMTGKPCIFINYDQPDAGDWSTDIIYRYEHFRSMPYEDCVWWWNERSDLPQLIRQLDSDVNTRINEWYRIINKHGASENIKELLLS